jgi:cell division protein FtsB
MSDKELCAFLRNNVGVSKSAWEAANKAADRIEELEAENARLKNEVKMLQHSATISYQAGIYDAELKGKADE